MKNEYRIAQSNLPKLTFEIEKLNRRALRLGVPPVTLTVTDRTEDQKITNDITGEVTQVRRFVFVIVEGETPKFAGWTLAACVEHSEEGNILRKSPSCSIELNQFRTGAQRCDHCKTTRDRRETYVVIHDSGDLKMIGSNCIKDFLGHQDPHALAKHAEFMFSVGELMDGAGDEEFFGGSTRRMLHVIGALSFAACAIRRLGFISSKRAKEDFTGNTQSTSSTAYGWMNPGKNDKLGKDFFLPEPMDRETAEKAKQHVMDTLGAKAPESLTDFEHNLVTLCKSEAVEPKNLGLLAFIPEFYTRALADKVQAASEAYFGEVGKRTRNVLLTYVKSTGWDSQYGYTYLHTFTGPAGERIMWKSGTNVDSAPGAKFNATFTIKSHEEFKGHKQTKVSRAVLDSVEKTSEVVPA